MEEDFSKLLDLLEKAANTEDQVSLEIIEKDIHLISSKIIDGIKGSPESNDDFKNLDVQKLEKLINKISDKHVHQKEFLSDFQIFLKSRKINWCCSL